MNQTNFNQPILSPGAKMAESDLLSRLNRLEVEVSAMREKVSFFSVIYDKFDNTLEKVQKMIEERRTDTNNDLKEVYGKIEDVETKIMNEISKLRDDMKAQHEQERKKIAELDKWRWIVMGGAVVIGWFISKVATFITYAGK
jgi:monomeric isocitrate dehydrogenase